MKNVVVILGAGASAPFGVPTLLRVFKDPFARLHLKKHPWLHQQMQELFWTPRGHRLDTSDLGLSVEEVLTIVRDYENQAYGVPPILPDQTEKFKRSLYVLIKKAIYDFKNSSGKYLNPLIQFMRENAGFVTWATFNWDCIFEASFYYSSGDKPYNRTNPRVVVDLQNWINTSGKHLFLKLHGGVNWWYENDTLKYLTFGKQRDLDNRWSQYELGKAQGHPVILEPSYYKYQDPIYEHLREQWDTFVQKLLGADLVVIVGYSLPEADLEARRALTIGFQSNTKGKFIVVDHAKWVCDRYERLFGTERLRTVKKSFEDIHEELPRIIGECTAA